MLKKIIFCLIFIFATGLFILPKSSFAASASVQGLDDNNNPVVLDENAAKAKITFSGLPTGQNYSVCIATSADAFIIDLLTVKGDGSCSDKTDFTITNGSEWSIIVCGEKYGLIHPVLGLQKNCGSNDYFHVYSYRFELASYTNAVIGRAYRSIIDSKFSVDPFTPKVIASPQKPTDKDTLKITINGSRRPIDNKDKRNTYTLKLTRNDNVFKPGNPSDLIVKPDGTGETTFGPLQNGDYTLEINGAWADSKFHQTFSIKIDPNGGGFNSGSNLAPGSNPCVGGTCQTALGPIKTDPAEFIKTVLGIATGLAGGIALIFMVIGSIKVLTSSGDQQKLTGGKDMIVAAVSGLLFLILSVLILRFIGNTFLRGLI